MRYAVLAGRQLFSIIFITASAGHFSPEAIEWRMRRWRFRSAAGIWTRQGSSLTWNCPARSGRRWQRWHEWRTLEGRVCTPVKMGPPGVLFRRWRVEYAANHSGLYD